MRHLAALLVLALATPAWANTVTVPIGGGKSTTLTPQQVQFMRWWRAQTQKTVRPTVKPQTIKLTIKPVALTTTKKVAITAIKVNRPAAKGTIVTLKPLALAVPAPSRRSPAGGVQAGLGSFGALNLVAIARQLGVAPTVSSSSASTPSSARASRSVSEPLRRQGLARGGLAVIASERQLKGGFTLPRARVAQTRPQLVGAQLLGAQLLGPQLGGSEPPPPNALTTLRYQLELSQME